jgi:YgiT-type zinc finger domain-containing protein
MKCANRRCPGVYEERDLAYTVRWEGEVMVIDHVPVRVCAACGDVRMRKETVKRIQDLLASSPAPTRRVPLLEYA